LDDFAPRLLFVPVSGAFGMGEYARLLAIAQGAQARWPRAAIQFLLSRQAPYAASVPFPATLLESSPTFHSGAVGEVIAGWHPTLVIFDNAGRTAQLRAARRAGARVVYISSRRRQRRKAFRLKWMRLIDEHWIAYPEFIAGTLHLAERLKLALMHRPTVRYLDVILARRMPPEAVAPGRYALVVPGGGTGHPGASDAVDQFLDAARRLAAQGVDTIFVGRAEAAPAAADADGAPLDGVGGGAPPGGSLRLLGSVPQAELAELMLGAHLVIANGGSTLLQAIACTRPCVAVPIAGDQADRIRRCVVAGVAVAAPLHPAVIAQTALDLLADEPRLTAMTAHAMALGLADGVDVALRAIGALLAAR